MKNVARDEDIDKGVGMSVDVDADADIALDVGLVGLGVDEGIGQNMKTLEFGSVHLSLATDCQMVSTRQDAQILNALEQSYKHCVLSFI